MHEQVSKSIFIISTMNVFCCRKVIIVMPVWADGEDNARRLTDRNAAVRVYKGDDGYTLYKAIVEAREVNQI